MGRFDGKVAVVTGSGRRSGLGEAIAQKLASEGATVVISDIGASKDASTPGPMIGATGEMAAIAAELRVPVGRIWTGLPTRAVTPRASRAGRATKKRRPARR